MMNSMHKIRDMVCTNLEEMSNKSRLSAADLDAVMKLTITKEKMLRIEELEQKLGYSQRSGMHTEAYARNSYNDGYMQYPREAQPSYMENQYGGNSFGNYMANGKEMMMDNMKAMLDDPMTSEADRNAIRRTMYMIGR